MGKGMSITLWAEDEATANNLVTDQFFLLGALLDSDSADVQTFKEALGEGGSLSYTMSPNRTKGGFNVELTVT